jgi:hypothetical protein
MKTRSLATTLAALLSAAWPATAAAHPIDTRAASSPMVQAAAECAVALVDDFSSGAYRSPDVKSGLEDATQTGAMIGGRRFTRVSVPSNVYGFPSNLVINPNGEHVLLVSSGYKGFTGFETVYGLKSATVSAPLHANLTCYDRFRVTFKGADGALGVIPIVYYIDPVTHGGRYGECGKVVPAGSTNGATLEFTFDCFEDGAGKPVADWSDITVIGLLVTAHGAIAGHDYALAKIELVNGCGQLICLP